MLHTPFDTDFFHFGEVKKNTTMGQLMQLLKEIPPAPAERYTNANGVALRGKGWNCCRWLIPAATAPPVCDRCDLMAVSDKKNE